MIPENRECDSRFSGIVFPKFRLYVELARRGRGFVVDWEHDTFSLLSGGVVHVGAGGMPAGAAPEFS